MKYRDSSIQSIAKTISPGFQKHSLCFTTCQKYYHVGFEKRLLLSLNRTSYFSVAAYATKCIPWSRMNTLYLDFCLGSLSYQVKVISEELNEQDLQQHFLQIRRMRLLIDSPILKKDILHKFRSRLEVKRAILIQESTQLSPKMLGIFSGIKRKS